MPLGAKDTNSGLFGDLSSYGQNMNFSKPNQQQPTETNLFADYGTY